MAPHRGARLPGEARNASTLTRRTLAGALIGGLLLTAVSLLAPGVAQAANTPPSISGTPDLAFIGVPYTYLFSTTGDPAPTCWTFGLPPGVTLDSGTCRLSGTPTGVGDYYVTVTASNGFNTASVTTVVTVAQPTGLADYSVPNGTAGQGYGYQLHMTGYPAPTAAALASAPLPDGLILDPSGYIHGTPTRAGTWIAGILVTNTYFSALVSLPITIDPASLQFTSGNPPAVVAGQPYSFTFTAEPGIAPRLFYTDSPLPAGLALDSSGVLSGTTTQLGDFPITVVARGGSDAEQGLEAQAGYTLHVGSAPTLTGTPPSAEVGLPYAFAFTATGTPAPSVQLSGGSLPTGLTLGSDGVLSGTPTQAGSFSLTLVADNGFGRATLTRTLSVAAPPITLRIADSQRAEGNSGTSPMTFTITLSAPRTGQVTVHWQTANGTAKAGSDYRAASGTVTFAPGQTVKTVTVLVLGDRIKEATETFHVRLSSPQGATIADGDALGRILNDD